MNRPDTPYEAASYDLKQFRERRMQDRRLMPRAGDDRRKSDTNGARAGTPELPHSDIDHKLN